MAKATNHAARNPVERAGGDKLVRAESGLFGRRLRAFLRNTTQVQKGEMPVVDLKFTPHSKYKYVVSFALGVWYDTSDLVGDWIGRKSSEGVIEALLNEAYKKFAEKPIGKSNETYYNDTIMDDASIGLEACRRFLTACPIQDVRKALRGFGGSCRALRQRGARRRSRAPSGRTAGRRCEADAARVHRQALRRRA